LRASISAPSASSTGIAQAEATIFFVSSMRAKKHVAAPV